MNLPMQEKSKKSGRWKPGESGNPAGRKPGTSEVSKLRKSIAQHMPEIINMLVESAKAGDVKAAQILLDRVVAPLKSTAQPVEIGISGSNVAELAREIIFGAASGRIGTDEAGSLIGAISGLAKIVEVTELEARLTALEAQHGND